MAGDWQGTLKAGAAELRLVLHIARSADGTLPATMDGPDQGVRGLTASALTLKEGRLSFKVENVRSTYLELASGAMEATFESGAGHVETLELGHRYGHLAHLAAVAQMK